MFFEKFRKNYGVYLADPNWDLFVRVNPKGADSWTPHVQVSNHRTFRVSLGLKFLVGIGQADAALDSKFFKNTQYF
jgi:hypothetical protein